MARVLEITNNTHGESVISLLEELEESDGVEIKRACSEINSIKLEMEFMHIITQEYAEYKACTKSDMNNNNNKIKRGVTNYLSAFLEFIDKWKAHTKRNKGERFHEKCLAAISIVYDNNFEYRFLHNLRNYAQHVGNPISTITNSVNEGLTILIDRESFIRSHKGMQASFKKELIKLEVEFLNIGNAIEIVHKELLKLHSILVNKSIEAASDEIIKSAVEILEFYNKFNKLNGELALGDYDTLSKMLLLNENSVDKININFSYIPHQVAKGIVKGTSLKYKYIGHMVGKTSGFPIIHKPEIAVLMPYFEVGDEFAERNGVSWIRIMNTTSWNDKRGYSKYFSVYMPMGLTMSEYSKEIEKYEEEKIDFLNDK